MKKLLFFFCLCFEECFFTVTYAQKTKDFGEQVGKIALSTYIQEDEPIGQATRKILTNKLNMIVTQNGYAGDGFDSRFIVTAHLQALEESTTATVPVMDAVELGVTIYVGDGVNGTLFSSWYTEVKGVGDSKDAAWMAAIKKIPNKNPELVAKLEEGKEKIVEYYNQVGPSIISKAQAAAKAGNYDEAIAELIVIPAASNVYGEAQKLIGSYGKTAADNANMNIVAQARAAWSTSADEAGAVKAEQILASLDNPSPEVMAAANTLSKEITSRMKQISDRQFQFEKQQAKWQHDYEMQANNNATKAHIASVNAAARVATAYWNSRPRIVHHVHWW